MNNTEIMYKVIETMAKMKLPVVFKGALVLKHVMSSNGVVMTYRGTKDIDMDWVHGNITDDKIAENIEKAINGLGIDGLSVEISRKSGEGRSAGFKVIQEGQKLFSFDVSLKNNPFSSEYITPSGVTFTGASIDKMYADKMYTISTKRIQRRVKDLYDLYLLSQLNGYSIDKILEITDYYNREIELFEEFIDDVEGLKHAYGTLKDVTNKPDFDVVYGRVRDFCMPFITGNYKDCKGIWSNKDFMWHDKI